MTKPKKKTSVLEQVAPKPDELRYYEISIDHWKGCASFVVTLPSGFRSKFEVHQTDPLADDFPAVRAQLLPYQVGNYRGQGLTVAEISGAEFHNLDGMSNRQLWSRAFGLRIRLGRSSTREEIIDAIREAEAN